jgi:hypothetical protein|tara:strand:- start:313 stop:789 length:477 start_codon:yes stop_codon:yes gene_type:complete
MKFDPFEHEHLFYEYVLKITESEVNQVLLLTKDVNTRDQKTTFEYLNVLNFPVLRKLKKQITDILDKHKLLLDNNWAQLYNKENEHNIHTHYGSVYSGIIYLKGVNCSPTYFYDSLFNSYIHTFKKNTLLMFPSMIPHEVKKLKTNEERLIISFNTKR